jgi:hypothetical protein
MEIKITTVVWLHADSRGGQISPDDGPLCHTSPGGRGLGFKAWEYHRMMALLLPVPGQGVVAGGV